MPTPEAIERAKGHYSHEAVMAEVAAILAATRRAADIIADGADSDAAARAFLGLQAARAELEKGVAP